MQTFAARSRAVSTPRRLLVAFALTAGLAACDGADPGDEQATVSTTTAVLDSTPAVAESTTTEPVRITRPSAGCNAASVAPGPNELSLATPDGEYRYEAHIPGAAERDEPLPVVVGFHGFTQPIDHFDQMSRLSAHGEANGYVVLLPAGISDIFAPLPGSGVDAVAMMLDDVAARACIDLDRVYATGISMGGTFTSLVGCELADRFAAVAPVAGSYFPESCPAARPVPALIFHGSADPRNPYGGSVATAPPALVDHSQPIAESAARWAERNGCDTAPDEDATDPEVTRIRWTCPEGTDVELLRLEGGGHQWPGDPQPGPEDVLGAPIAAPDATEVMWEFFRTHAMSDPG